MEELITHVGKISPKACLMPLPYPRYIFHYSDWSYGRQLLIPEIWDICGIVDQIYGVENMKIIKEAAK